MNRAIKLLAAKPRSVAELRGRLLEKGWTDEQIVNEVIGKLMEYGYLNDEQYARDFALSALRRKPQGRRRLERSIGEKKIDKDAREKAVIEAFEQLPESDLIELAIEKRIRIKGRPETREDKKKFFDYLLRQGFDYELIRNKMSLPDA